MARAKQGGILATGAAVLTSTDGGCLMQLEGSLRRAGAPIRVQHLVPLLWEGIRRARSA
jgi:L-lactate dehydrogenase complex protein LldE